MRLTSDLILRSAVFINTVNEREIDLRGNKLQIIENLGATQDEYEAIDLSDNQITSLSNFPLLKRLRTVFINNNLVSNVGAGIGKALPNLEVLTVTNNELATLSDIAAITELAKLTHLSLLHNPVTAVPHYRDFLIHKMPTLEVLDFIKIKRKERYKAGVFFTQTEEGKALLASVQSGSGGAVAAVTQQGQTKRQKMDAEANEAAEQVKARIRNAIMKAESIDDLAKLQAALRSQNHTDEFMAHLENVEREIASKASK